MHTSCVSSPTKKHARALLSHFILPFFFFFFSSPPSKIRRDSFLGSDGASHGRWKTPKFGHARFPLLLSFSLSSLSLFLPSSLLPAFLACLSASSHSYAHHSLCCCCCSLSLSLSLSFSLCTGYRRYRAFDLPESAPLACNLCSHEFRAGMEIAKREEVSPHLISLHSHSGTQRIEKETRR